MARRKAVPDQVVGFDGTRTTRRADRLALNKSVSIRRCRQAATTSRCWVHLRHDRRAESHDALPPRSVDHRRRLREGGLSVDARHVFVGSPPWRSLSGSGGLGVPVALRCRSDASRMHRRRTWSTSSRRTGRPSLHGADGVTGDADARTRAPTCHHCAPPSLPVRPCRRPCTTRGWRRRQADARRHRRDRDAAHLHLQPVRRLPAGMHGTPVGGYEAKMSRRHARVAAQHDRQLPARPDGCRYLARTPARLRTDAGTDR